MDNSIARLKEFQRQYNVNTKGPLSLVVQLTRIIREKDFPLDPDSFLTKNKGQVAGLGGANLKKILAGHGITRILAAEGGRTSRGNMGLMIEYVNFLNEWNKDETIDFDLVEEFWANQVQAFFNNQPLTLTSDSSKTIAASLDELFEQARKRQKENPGTQYLGTVIQHLVGAKLMTILPEDALEIYGASVADSPTERSGDFVIKNTIIHCTTAPGEPLLQKCRANLGAGCNPVIITLYSRVQTALSWIDEVDLGGRVDVWDIQQFLSTNINEHSYFDIAARNEKLGIIIENYNAIIDKHETDPSLKIEFEAK